MTAMDKRVLTLSHQAQAQGIAVEKVLRDAISTRENLTAAIIATMKDLTPEHRRWVEEFKEIIVTEMAGLATVYAGDGGIIAAV